MLDFLIDNIGGVATYTGIGTVSAALLFLLKKIPNAKIQKFMFNIGYSAGVCVTGGLAKWSWSAKYWNAIVEKYMIDLIDNVFCIIPAFIQGLRSDDKK